MIDMIKAFPNFAVFSGSDSLALETVKNGGAGAITATANISAPLLTFIVNNAKDENKNQILQEAHLLQDKIRKLVFSQEQIAFMKAIMKVKNNDSIWDMIMPPLVPLKDLNNNIKLNETLPILDEINKLSSKF